MFVAHIEHGHAPLFHTCGHNPMVVAGNENPNVVVYFDRVDVLEFDRVLVARYQIFQDTLSILVTGPKCLFRAQQQAFIETGIEPPREMARLAQRHAMHAKELAHNLYDYAFTRTLLAAQNECCSGFLGWVLDNVGEPSHDPFSMGLVALADIRSDMV